MPERHSPAIFLGVGEFSGELLALDLVREMRRLNKDVRFFGVTGKHLQAAGVDSIAHYEALSVMGFGQVVAKLGDLRLFAQHLLAEIDRRRPQAAILVDYPGLHFYLAEQLALRRIPVIQYVAPKVWAWGKGRISKLRRDFSLVLGMLPFEIEFFAKHGVNYHYVGSPLRDRADEVINTIAARSPLSRERFGVEKFSPLLGFLPGSRLEEIKYILPLLPQLHGRLKQMYPNIGWVLPIADSIDRDTIYKYLGKEHASAITLVSGNSLELMRMADACVVASGTATLECALLQTPLLAVYRMNEINYHLARKLVKISWISLVNLVLNKGAIREFIQDFSCDEIAAEVRDLLESTSRRSALAQDYAELQQRLAGNAARTAAQKIMEFLPS